MSHKSRKRSKASYRRRKPSKKPRKTILIICEGEKTEPNYFRYLKSQLNLQTINIEIIGLGKQTINLVEEAIKCIAEREHKGTVFAEYDQVWCVSDVEIPREDNTISDAFQKAAGYEQIKIALSNPCFEYWYILHFEKCSPFFNNNLQVLRHLKKHFGTYKKNSDEICRGIYPDTEEAIKRAEDLEKSVSWGPDLRKHNSSTHVHHLVRLILEISKM